MSAIHKHHIFFIGVVLAILFALLVVVPPNFPFLGLSLWFIALSSIVYTLKPKKDLFTNTLFVLSLLTALGISIRSQGFLVFLNIVGTLYFGTLMALQDKERVSYGLVETVLAPFVIGLQSFATKNKYIFQIKLFFKYNHGASPRRGREIVIGTVIAALLLWLIIPLLSSANPIFGDWAANILKIFDLSFLIGDNLGLYIGRAAAVIILTFFIPRFLTRTHGVPDKYALNIENRPGINLSIPKIAIAVVIGIFFLSQAQLYMASTQELYAMGYSNSDLTREVFGQLSVVTLIILGLIYYDKRSAPIARNTTYILLGFGLLLSLVALKSVLDYIFQWGLTQKRLYGLTTVFWVYGIYALFMYTYIKRLIRTTFVRKAVIWTGVTLIALNLVNFDYLIYHRNQTRDPYGVDHEYLAGLSSDTLARGEHLEYVFEQLRLADRGIIEPQRYITVSTLHRLYWDMRGLRDKYDTPDVRWFNVLEYISYTRSVDVDLESIDAYISGRN